MSIEIVGHTIDRESRLKKSCHIVCRLSSRGRFGGGFVCAARSAIFVLVVEPEVYERNGNKATGRYTGGRPALRRLCKSKRHTLL